MDPVTLAALSPIPDLCPPSSIAIVTGASHSGKRQFILGLLPLLLTSRAILDSSRRPYAATRLDRSPRVGWLTLTHGSPQTSQALLAAELLRYGLASVAADASFCHRALATGKLTQAADPGHSCPLTRSVLLDVFSGAFGTRPGSHSTLALPELLILDDLHTLLLDGSPNSPYHVSRLMHSLTSVLHECGITLIAFALETKLKTGERYGKIPSRILGSVAWGHSAHSVWLVDQDGEDEKLAQDGLTPVSRLTIVRQGEEMETYWLEKDERGLLVPSTLDAMVEWDAALDAWLNQQPIGTIVTTADIELTAAKSGGSRHQAQRWIRRQRDAGRLETGPKIRRGAFKVRAIM